VLRADLSGGPATVREISTALLKRSREDMATCSEIYSALRGDRGRFEFVLPNPGLSGTRAPDHCDDSFQLIE